MTPHRTASVEVRPRERRRTYLCGMSLGIRDLFRRDREFAAGAAILGCTMAEHPVPRAPRSDTSNGSTKAAGDEPAPTPKQLQATAHARGRICKVRGCEVCAPLRERRRLKKAQRKADAQAQHHDRGEPCGRTNCPEPACVRARHVDDEAAPDVVPRAEESDDDPDEAHRRQLERHRAGLPCGSETCPNHHCVEAFARERARRHRAGRPCRSADCANPTCASGRSAT